MPKSYEIAAVGIAKITVSGATIETKLIPFENVNTISIYLSSENQSNFEIYIIKLKPKRIIFNPDAEHSSFALKHSEKGIVVKQAYTLALLRTDQH